MFLLKVKVSLAPVGTIKKDLDESQLQEVVTEIVVGALRGTNVHLNLSKYPTCPRLWREPPPQQGFTLPHHYDSMVRLVLNNFILLLFVFFFLIFQKSFI